MKSTRLNVQDVLLEADKNSSGEVVGSWWNSEKGEYSISKRGSDDKYETVVLRTRDWHEAKAVFRKLMGAVK